MARGWESKSVESQIEMAEDRRARAAAVELSADEIRRSREREGLESSIARVLRDIAEAKNPPYRRSLEAALQHLNDKLTSLGE